MWIKFIGLILFFSLPAFSQQAGEMRYNTTANTYEYYDGASYLDMDNGTTGVACSDLAAVQYNTSQNRLEFCNGSFWHSLMGKDTTTGCSEAGEYFYDLGTTDYNICNGTTLHQTKSDRLIFTTSSQTLHNKVCSGVVTVQTQFGGVATNVASDLTVNLTGTGYVFYGDAQCSTAPITSRTITTGNNSSSFYFRQLNVVTNEPITATATGYMTDTITNTTTTNPFVWTGGANPTTTWSTGGNWSGGTAPGSSDVAIFDGSCSVNCNPTFSSATTVGGIRMETEYIGTITQGNFDINLNELDFVMLAGTFIGGTNSTDDIKLGSNDGKAVIAGGTFTFPDGQFRVNDYRIRNSPTLNFRTNSELHIFGNLGTNTNHQIYPGTYTYQNVRLDSRKGSYNFQSNDWIIAGNLILEDKYGLDAGFYGPYSLRVGGDVTMADGGFGENTNATARIVLTGNASGQTITGNGTGLTYMFPPIELDTGTNNVTFEGNVRTSRLIGTSFGTITVNSTNFVLSTDILSHPSMVYTAGNQTFNNLSISARKQSPDFGGVTLTVNGNLTIGASIGDGRTLNNVHFDVKGNFTINNNGYNGTATIEFSGTGAQSMTNTSSRVPDGTITVNKSSGTLTMATAFNFNGSGQDLTITNGTMDLAGFALTVSDVLTIGTGTTLTQNGGTLTYGSLVNNGTLNP